MNEYIEIAPEVAAALSSGVAVVALESTLIAHGLPSPLNVETAHAAELRVRERGAIPATVAVIDGKIRVGLEAGQIEQLAGTDVAKLSSADLGAALAGGGVGATTVAATMVAAHLAGIRLFATGGIGGVHQGASASFDVSGDLEELGRTPVAVVCSGAKAILDLPATLEYLETKGVPVFGFGTRELPAFFSSSSGLVLAHSMDSPEELATAVRAHWAIRPGTGVVIANPPPIDVAIDRDVVDSALTEALEEAEAGGVSGKETTPFLLSRIAEITQAATVDANVALIEANAGLAAEIAGVL